ncbi:UNVERIFIED_CONTAM: Methylesterase 10 [Sesamum angustifolium]|uniref:Methylesterase 10 n=1 Tax=Sesamum angustifolium TaxID=2727405 RepID=A0AAW2NM20_9LAMI
MVENSEKKHFVLVHGLSHGAWCWYKLVSLLKLQGHKVTALDLGGCGVHPKQLHQISSISDYIHPLLDSLAALPDDQTVILVGHSYGGISISLAMENFPGKISVAVFVSAYMPNCSDPPATLIQEFLKRSSTNSLMDCEITFDHQTSQNLPISAAFGPEYMAKMYANCPSEDLELAKTMVRPSLIFLEELSKTCLLSEERYGAVKRCYVICEEDEVMEEEFQRYIIDKSPPEDVVSIAGAGHMIMLAKPQELCSCLTELAS